MGGTFLKKMRLCQRASKNRSKFKFHTSDNKKPAETPFLKLPRLFITSTRSFSALSISCAQALSSQDGQVCPDPPKTIGGRSRFLCDVCHTEICLMLPPLADSPAISLLLV